MRRVESNGSALTIKEPARWPETVCGFFMPAENAQAMSYLDVLLAQLNQQLFNPSKL